MSRDRQRLRRFLSCLPASKPDLSTPSSQFLSAQNQPFLPPPRPPLKAGRRLSHGRITSSQEPIADSTCRPPLFRSLASTHEHASRATVRPTLNLFMKPSFARFEATTSTPRKPDCFPNSTPFSLQFLLRSLLRNTSTPLSEADKLLPPAHLLFLATPSQPTGRGPPSGEGRKKREPPAHHHRTNNKTCIPHLRTHMQRPFQRTTELNMHLMGELT